jgi:tetratricopeptide (TPR) repeat protein
MSTADWMKRQQEAARSLTQQGSQALRQNNTDLAAAALTEAAVILDMAAAEADDLDRLRAQIFNEMGVVHQRRSDLGNAKQFHQQAAVLCAKVVEAGNEPDFRGNAAATHLNLANICMAIDDQATAREAAEKAQALVDLLMSEEKEPINPLFAGVYHTLAAIYGKSGEWESADERIGKAVELARKADDLGINDLLPQVAQGCQQVSVLAFQSKDYDRAVRWGREAEELSKTAFEKIGQDTLPIYIVSQINLISYYEQAGHYSDAEDSLWNALEVVGNDPRMLKRGKDFYELCRKQADARLNTGGLPREEVEEGYQEILSRIEEIGGLPAELEAEENEAQ